VKQLCVIVIGVGAVDPDYVTVQAVKALNRVDVFFVVEKGSAKDDLVRLRRNICDCYIEDPSSYRLVYVDDSVRDRISPGLRSGRRALARRADGALRGAHRKRAGRGRDRRLPRVGRPVPLRAHAWSD
jgi:precorrin-2 methylase